MGRDDARVPGKFKHMILRCTAVRPVCNAAIIWNEFVFRLVFES